MPVRCIGSPGWIRPCIARLNAGLSCSATALLPPVWSRLRLPDGGLNVPAGWRFAVDRGGTFTDVVGVGPDGTLHTGKVLSRDPQRPGDPALRGIAAVLDRHGDRLGRQVDSVRLGTTVATNALLERQGAPTLLLTSAGMQDALRDRLPAATRHLRARDPPAAAAVPRVVALQRANRRGRQRC